MKSFFFVVFLLVLFSCSSEGNEKAAEVFVEKFPDVNLKDFDTITYNKTVEFIIPKGFSIAQTKSDQAVLSYSHLLDEVTVELSAYPVSAYQRSLDAQGLSISKDSLFNQFTEDQYHLIAQQKKEVEEKEDYLSLVNDINTRYYRLNCKRHGFPFKQSLSLRFYEDHGTYYILQFLCLASDVEALTDIEDAVMLSLKRK